MRFKNNFFQVLVMSLLLSVTIFGIEAEAKSGKTGSEEGTVVIDSDFPYDGEVSLSSGDISVKKDGAEELKGTITTAKMRFTLFPSKKAIAFKKEAFHRYDGKGHIDLEIQMIEYENEEPIYILRKVQADIARLTGDWGPTTLASAILTLKQTDYGKDIGQRSLFGLEGIIDTDLGDIFMGIKMEFKLGLGIYFGQLDHSADNSFVRENITQKNKEISLSPFATEASKAWVRADFSLYGVSLYIQAPVSSGGYTSSKHLVFEKGKQEREYQFGTHNGEIEYYYLKCPETKAGLGYAFNNSFSAKAAYSKEECTQSLDGVSETIVTEKIALELKYVF